MMAALNAAPAAATGPSGSAGPSVRAGAAFPAGPTPRNPAGPPPINATGPPPVNAAGSFARATRVAPPVFIGGDPFIQPQPFVSVVGPSSVPVLVGGSF